MSVRLNKKVFISISATIISLFFIKILNLSFLLRDFFSFIESKELRVLVLGIFFILQFYLFFIFTYKTLSMIIKRRNREVKDI